MLVFLAPESGGDLRTLINAVQGRPGAFVRTSQDLNQAALDSSRLDSYLRAVHALDETAPQKLKDGRAAARAQPRDQGQGKLPRPHPGAAGPLPDAAARSR